MEPLPGRTFLLYHAYDASAFEFVGRQALLDEVTWNPDGWPAINGGKGPSGSAPAPSRIAQRATRGVIEDEFDKPRIDPGWQWPWDQGSAPSVEAGQGGWLRLSTGSAAMAVVARPTRGANYTATTLVDLTSITPGTRAGLAAFGNRDNVLAATVERQDGSTVGGGLTVVVWQAQKGERRILATAPARDTGQFHLRLSARERTRFEFAVSPDGRTWTAVGGAEGEYLPPWDLAVRVALLVTGHSGSFARFGTFRLEAD